jgi:hypothetical protein
MSISWAEWSFPRGIGGLSPVARALHHLAKSDHPAQRMSKNTKNGIASVY